MWFGGFRIQRFFVASCIAEQVTHQSVSRVRVLGFRVSTRALAQSKQGLGFRSEPLLYIIITIHHVIFSIYHILSGFILLFCLLHG